MPQTQYDFGSATFFFLKTLSRRPWAVATIAIFQTLAYAALFAIVLAAFLPVFGEIAEAAARGEEPDEAAIVTSLAGVFFYGLLAALFAIAVALMVQAAWLRLMTRDEIKPVIPFRFGGDELRLLGVNIVFIGFAAIGYILAALIVALFAGVGAGAGAVADGELWSAVLTGFLAFIGFVIAAVAAILVMIKFAAAPAMTVHDRRFRLFEAWPASKGVVGWMFLSYLVLVVIILVAALIIGIIQQIAVIGGVLSAAPGLMALSEGQIEDPAVVLQAVGEALSNPGVLIAAGVTLLLQVAFQVFAEGLWHGVGAYVAVRHAGGDLAAPENTAAPSASIGDAPDEG